METLSLVMSARMGFVADMAVQAALLAQPGAQTVGIDFPPHVGFAGQAEVAIVHFPEPALRAFAEKLFDGGGEVLRRRKVQFVRHADDVAALKESS